MEKDPFCSQRWNTQLYSRGKGQEGNMWELAWGKVKGIFNNGFSGSFFRFFF